MPPRPRVTWRWNAYTSRKVSGGVAFPDGTVARFFAPVIRDADRLCIWRLLPANTVRRVPR